MAVNAANNQITLAGGSSYGYDAQERRVWKGALSGGVITSETDYPSDLDGTELASYTLNITRGQNTQVLAADGGGVAAAGISASASRRRWAARVRLVDFRRRANLCAHSARLRRCGGRRLRRCRGRRLRLRGGRRGLRLRGWHRHVPIRGGRHRLIVNGVDVGADDLA